MTELLRLEDLTTRFYTEDGQINAVEGVNFSVEEGEIFGIVGESGSGKSVTALSIVDLVEDPGRIVEGHIWFRQPDLADDLRSDNPSAVDGDMVDLRALTPRQRRALRGTSFSMIFQDPTSSFNPSITVGEQIAEAVEVQRRATANPRSTASRTQGFGLAQFAMATVLPSREFVTPKSEKRAVELLDLVGIPDPAQRAKEYPHQFSGGMLQRAMIAQALASDPDVLIADEPTTALDVTIQAQVLNLLERIQQETGMTIVLITHNLGVIARTCHNVGVMYAGEMVERGTLRDIFEDSVHPYTQGLIGSVPRLEDVRGRLEPIPGNVPGLKEEDLGDRCYFADRCPKAMEDCLDKPPMYSGPGSDQHQALCYLADLPYDPEKAIPEGFFDE